MWSFPNEDRELYRSIVYITYITISNRRIESINSFASWNEHHVKNAH